MAKMSNFKVINLKKMNKFDLWLKQIIEIIGVETFFFDVYTTNDL